jgi:hypothetical protein
MAITVVQSSNTCSISATAAGNLLVVWAYTAAGVTTNPTLSDNKGSTYSRATIASSAAAKNLVAVFYLLSTAAGITTLTISGATLFHVKEYTGGVFSFDKSNSIAGTFNGTSANANVIIPSTTPTNANELVVLGVSGAAPSGQTISSISTPTNFTSLNTSGIGSQTAGGAFHWIQTSIVAANPTSTITRSATGVSNWGAEGFMLLFSIPGGHLLGTCGCGA